MFGNSLESFEKPQSLQHASPDRKVVESNLYIVSYQRWASLDGDGYVGRESGNTDLLHNSFAINDEHTPQADTLILDQYSIISTDAMCGITEQGYVNHAKPTILSRHILPVPKRVLSIDRYEDDAAFAILELVQAVLEG
jgi:hypothetical protein